LVAAAQSTNQIGAVVSRGGRPDLAAARLNQVTAPTLLIVGANDTGVIELNEQAYQQLRCKKDLRLVPGATHLFEETGALEKVARLASDWFRMHLDSKQRGFK
jgi:pimeloyl-ACP methyl ester carboxylesterase